MFLFFDTETTGLPKSYYTPIGDTENWPRMVQAAWILRNKSGTMRIEKKYTIKPIEYEIPEEATLVHGITTEYAAREGCDIVEVLLRFDADVGTTVGSESGYFVAHNAWFDKGVVGTEFYRLGIPVPRAFIDDKRTLCTMLLSTDYCRIPGINRAFEQQNHYKWPRLSELYEKLFGTPFEGAHDALNDTRATERCFFELVNRGVINIDKKNNEQGEG